MPARRVSRRNIDVLWLQVAAALVFLALPAAGQDAASQIQTEINRLQQALSSTPASVPGFPPDLKSQVGKQLESAAEAARAGQLYLSLERLAPVPDLLSGIREVSEKSGTEKVDMPAFEAEWGKTSVELTALEQKTRAHSWDSAPAAIRALAEAAQGKAIPLLDGGRGFATALGPREGLFYVGQAQGEAEFAQFCAALNLPRRQAPLALRSMLPELESLQEKTNAAFQPPRSVDLHPQFIVLNSALKLAEELDAGRFYAGAFYEYLESLLQYGLLDAPALTAAQQSEVQAAVAAARQKLAGSGRDDSLAELFLERAESHVARAGGPTPSEDDWRRAKLIVDQVLPAYFAALKASVPLEQASAGRVEITLVRWPYT